MRAAIKTDCSFRGASDAGGGASAAPAALRVLGGRFVDELGREVMLRGVNLGGDCKLPIDGGETWRNDDFSGHRSVSFVGRPFPLSQADEHFARLAGWGFNCLRLVTTWEAVEHAGPGRHDANYLDYLAAICAAAGSWGLYVIVDFHQDAWSRMTGGSGAPGWTLEAAGLDIARLEEAGAALTMQRSFDEADPSPHQPNYPPMVWGSNYRLPANRIMWTLFWMGGQVVPDHCVDWRNIQYLLQDCYLGCLREVARRVAHLPNVIGFDSLNEPSIGWLGCALSEVAPDQLSPGLQITPLDALAAAQGIPVEVALGGKAAEPAPATLNPDAIRIWRDEVPCPFAAAGIYAMRDGRAVALRDDAFQRNAQGNPLSVPDDVFAGFFARVADTIRAFNPDWSLFAEVEVLGPLFGRGYPAAMPERSVSAPHWYDVATLFTKRFDAAHHVDPVSGRTASGEDEVAAMVRRGLAQRGRMADSFGPAPTLIGEIGIPFDLDEGEAYARWRVGERDAAFALHELLLGLMYDALDDLGLHATLWNYTASNRNDPRVGDGWNQEDLSIFSRDQIAPGCDGGRGVRGFARPYPRAVQGRLDHFRFDRAEATLTVSFEADPTIWAPTAIAVPTATMGEHPLVESSAPIELLGVADGVLRLRALKAGQIDIRVTADSKECSCRTA